MADPNPNKDGVVQGTNADDTIGAGFVDANGDCIDGADAIAAGAGPDDDVIDAGAGDDSIDAGAGDDSVLAGSGNDTVLGGAGADTIEGDGRGSVAGAARESFEWTEQGPNDTTLTTFSQNTGTVNVDFSITNSVGPVRTDVTTDEQLVSDIDSGTETIDPFSALNSLVSSDVGTVTYNFGFDSQISNVEFRINDVDVDSIVTVRAFVSDGAGGETPVIVNLTGGERLTLTDTDGVPGVDQAFAPGNINVADTAPTHSVLVEIPGPITRMEIDHARIEGTSSGVKITDIYFDAAAADTGPDGDDSIDGGEGADVIFAGGGSDTILGGAGDTIDGGSEGTDQDVLDLTGQGPFILQDVTDDSNGNGINGTVVFVDADSVPTGETLTFTEIEQILGDEINRQPVAEKDEASTDENTPVTIDVLANDTDPDDDTLTIAADPAPTSPNGTVVINPDGTITFTPETNFVGPTTVEYTVEDGQGGTATATVFIDVGTVRDGIVSGTPGGDLIDTDYTGDPEGDRVDNDDAILPGEVGDDDIIEAGDGDDTILAGDGDDEVSAGDGDDQVDAGDGDDSVLGEGGDDTITAGDGNDTVAGGPGNDNINTVGSTPLPDIGYPGIVAADPDPNDDLDLVFGGDGDDTIATGDDTDTITAGDGDDRINAGIDDDNVDAGGGADRVVGGEGNDFILGGTGNDTIFAGNDPDLGLDQLDIEDDGSNPLGPDLRPGNGRDTVLAGAGDDVVFGADDADELFGGDGNDSLDGGIDDDTIFGGADSDTLIGGQGNDELVGGTGKDQLFGGIGEDTLLGGADGDLLAGGFDSSPDLIFGNEDNDTIVGASAGDVVDGGFGGFNEDPALNTDFDILDLTGTAPPGGSLTVTIDGPDSNGNGFNGNVKYFDADGNPAGELIFTEIEQILNNQGNVVPCFTPGTRIATPSGERLVETLKVGDLVLTRDNGIKPIQWVGRCELSAEELAVAEHLRAIVIPAGALGHGLPERDMKVSPNHRVLITSDQAELLFEDREVLVAAKHLVGMGGIHWAEAEDMTYIHVMFDQHEVILSDGAWTESFQPGVLSLNGIDAAQRRELLELFPELARPEGLETYVAARRILKKHEALLLTQ